MLYEVITAIIQEENPSVLNMLSSLGKNLFFPKGILTQSAEAKEKAHKYNATIGIATEKGGPMFLQCIQDKLSAFDPKDIYPYAPPAGKPELRALWREKMLRDRITSYNVCYTKLLRKRQHMETIDYQV